MIFRKNEFCTYRWVVSENKCLCAFPELSSTLLILLYNSVLVIYEWSHLRWRVSPIVHWWSSRIGPDCYGWGCEWSGNFPCRRWSRGGWNCRNVEETRPAAWYRLFAALFLFGAVKIKWNSFKVTSHGFFIARLRFINKSFSTETCKALFNTCCAHPKAGRNTFFSRFQLFLFIFSDFTAEISSIMIKKLNIWSLKRNKNTTPIDNLLFLKEVSDYRSLGVREKA